MGLAISNVYLPSSFSNPNNSSAVTCCDDPYFEVVCIVPYRSWQQPKIAVLGRNSDGIGHHPTIGAVKVLIGYTCVVVC